MESSKEEASHRLGAHGMVQSGEEADQWVRVVIEKPFGTDLVSAKKLNDDVNAVLSENQVFRIDHYLGKETVQNILFFRFGNGIFEPIWNRNYIDRVELTLAETVGVEGRGPFYEKAGALRDILQNHAMEVLALIAMEPPESFQAEAVRSEKLKVCHSIAAIPLEHAIRGQYGPGTIEGKKVVGYRQEDRVSPESGTETFAEVRLEIANWRWAGVPFHLRTGKRLAKRFTEARIIFRASPTQLFKQDSGIGESEQNVITLRIQPDDGICLQFGVKPPGLTADFSKVAMRFSYEAAFGKSSANGEKSRVLYSFFSACLALLCAARFFPCASSLDWMACALTMARISPGKRCSSSVQRDVLWTSTPRRSPRISPASLSSLKC